MVYLEIANSIVLLLLVGLLFFQNNKLKFMKSAMDAYQPEKLKQAQDYIDRATEERVKLMVSEKIDTIHAKTSSRYRQINKTFLGCYEELTYFLFAILKQKDWEEREKLLSTFPKNAEYMREVLEAHDDGSLYESDDK